jgi:outer membrane beta-barrel protein
VKCLDESLVDEFGRTRAREGIQPRDFRKALRVSLWIGGGGVAGDLVDTQWQGTGGLQFWIAEDFGIEGQFRVQPLTYRLERSATGFTQQDRYPDGVAANLAYTAMGHLLWAPIHTKLRGRGDRIIHGDVVLFGGAGPTFHHGVRGLGFDVGASLYLYPTRWFALRMDLADHVLPMEVFGSRRLSNNLAFTFGISVWIPPRRR